MIPKQFTTLFHSLKKNLVNLCVMEETEDNIVFLLFDKLISFEYMSNYCLLSSFNKIELFEINDFQQYRFIFNEDYKY